MNYATHPPGRFSCISNCAELLIMLPTEIQKISFDSLCEISDPILSIILFIKRPVIWDCSYESFMFIMVWSNIIATQQFSQVSSEITGVPVSQGFFLMQSQRPSSQSGTFTWRFLRVTDTLASHGLCLCFRDWAVRGWFCYSGVC